MIIRHISFLLTARLFLTSIFRMFTLFRNSQMSIILCFVRNFSWRKHRDTRIAPSTYGFGNVLSQYTPQRTFIEISLQVPNWQSSMVKWKSGYRNCLWVVLTLIYKYSIINGGSIEQSTLTSFCNRRTNWLAWNNAMTFFISTDC